MLVDAAAVSTLQTADRDAEVPKGHERLQPVARQLADGARACRRMQQPQTYFLRHDAWTRSMALSAGMV